MTIGTSKKQVVADILPELTEMMHDDPRITMVSADITTKLYTTAARHSDYGSEAHGTGAVLLGLADSGSHDEQRDTGFPPADVPLLESQPGWTIHVPGHADEARQLLRSALAGRSRVYLRLSTQSNREPHAAAEVVKKGENGVVLAVGPVLDRVLSATTGLGVTVLYTCTVRPFDAIGLRTAVLAGDHADVVIVEPYYAGTSAYWVSDALSNIPHRLLSLGSRRGGGTDITESAIATEIRAFLR